MGTARGVQLARVLEGDDLVIGEIVRIAALDGEVPDPGAPEAGEMDLDDPTRAEVSPGVESLAEPSSRLPSALYRTRTASAVPAPVQARPPTTILPSSWTAIALAESRLLFVSVVVYWLMLVVTLPV